MTTIDDLRTGTSGPPGPGRVPASRTAPFITDGGIETTLIFDHGIDLPDFAAFPLLEAPVGRGALIRYYESYLEIARRDGVGIVLETATWRASTDWAARLGWGPERLRAANRRAVTLVRELTEGTSSDTPVVVSGCVGPRGDGYVVGTTMGVDEAHAYHALQVDALTGAGSDLVTAITMTYTEEAIGVVEAARAAGSDVVISFTVETDGRLPSGQTLGGAIDAVDQATDGYPAYYMVNCAHPTHFAQVLEGRPAWTSRLGGVRANASRASHAELDEAEVLDRGDPAELANDYLHLWRSVPTLRVFGGCCGTDHHHVAAISETLTGAVEVSPGEAV